MADPVSRFRKLTGRKGGKPKRQQRPSVPPRERALVLLCLINLLWLGIALGGVRLWGEIPAALLAVACLLLLPRWKHGEIHGMQSPVIQLLKLPLFWLGFGLYTYFFIQSWNLAWTYQIIDGGSRMISQHALFDWLPKGITSPFDEANPIRSMIFYSIPWITCSAAWAGINTRRGNNWLLHGMAWIGGVFAIVALYQNYQKPDHIIGLFPILSSRAGQPIPFWGTLNNANHGAYLLILSTGLSLGLFLSGWYRDLKYFKRSGGAWLLYLGLALLTSFAVLMAQARGATGFIVLEWLVFLAICTVFFIRRFGIIGLTLPGLFGLVILSAGVNFLINPDIFEKQKDEWISTFTLVENPELEARYYMMQIASDMIEDKPLFGHGAGSWRYMHLPYLQDYPEFNTKKVRWERNPITKKMERRNIQIWFKNAHVDILEYFVEWGIIGCLFPILAGLWLLYHVIRSLNGLDPGTLVQLATIMVVLLAAFVEFHFRIPFVLLFWCLLFSATVKLIGLNSNAS